MTKIVCLITIILFSTKNLASYPYLHFKDTQIEMPQASFTRYVEPQLSAIVTDFYKIIKLNQLTEIVDIVAVYKKLKQTINEKNIETNYVEIYKQVNAFEIELLKLSNSWPDLSQVSVKQLLRLSMDSSKITNSTYELLHIFEAGLALEKEELTLFIQEQGIELKIHQLLIRTRMALIDQSPTALHDYLDFVMSNFIAPIEDHLSQTKDYRQLASRLEELNMAWNSFHQNLTKGNLKIDSQTNQTLGMIHARWVSILKVMLKKPMSLPSE